MERHFESLSEFLAETGTTQEQLAESLEVSQATVSRIVRGLQMPEAALAIRIQELTGVSVEALARARTQAGAA